MNPTLTSSIKNAIRHRKLQIEKLEQEVKDLIDKLPEKQQVEFQNS